jgi:large subunit ribosomal protein L5e
LLYFTAYATGLLLARRVLTKLKLADKYQGESNPTGKHFVVQALEDGPKPFTVLLDVGLTRTSTGNRVFATMKGAADGGLYVPHSTRRLAGYNAQDKKFNADVLRKYIFGGHVAEYMKQLQKEDPESYKRQFARFVKEKINPDDLEKIYKAAHAAIRKDPTHTKKASKFSGKPKRFNEKKLTQAQRKASLAKRIAALKAASQ